MAILKIARMGHPVLRGVARPVDDPTSPEIRRLVADMLDTMADANGAGLAAPQVHVPLRLVIFHAPPERTGGEGVGLTVLINPVVEVLDAGVELGYEGCLSVPGLTGEVPRHRKVRYSGVDHNGEPVHRVAEGFHARVVQHECDHLDGVLYPARMQDLSRLGFVEEVRRAMREGD